MQIIVPNIVPLQLDQELNTSKSILVKKNDVFSQI